MRDDGWRDVAAAELAARYAAVLGLSGPVLVMEDPLPTLPSALMEMGLSVHRYARRALVGRAASSWPSGGPYGTVALRLPRAADELRMWAHAAVGLMEPDGRLLLYGAKDEGAASASSRIENVFGEVETVATGKRCRVLLARSPRIGSARTRLDDWAVGFDPELEELHAPWTSFPGVFAHGRLDGGTALLIQALPTIPERARVLDFGCGHGVLGAVVAARSRSAEVAFLDVDALALEAVRRNVPGAPTFLSDGWGGMEGGAWDVIVSNPPWHAGKSETLGVMEELVSGAARRLARGGWLALVTQRRLPVESRLSDSFADVAIIGDGGGWRVWRAQSPIHDHRTLSSHGSSRRGVGR